MVEDVTKHSVHTLVFRSLKRTHDMFISDQGNLPSVDETANKIWRTVKARSMYGPVMAKVNQMKERQPHQSMLALENQSENTEDMAGSTNGQMSLYKAPNQIPTQTPSSGPGSKLATLGGAGTALQSRKPMLMPKPNWHAPWKLSRVISGHMGWVRCVAVEPGNEWFCTGAADRVIKIWDLASGKLKLSLTGHVSTVRGLAVSPRQPYLFSCGEDRQVKCWDLEYNKVIRHYHGHLSAVYDLALHPTIDILVTCGRDSTARVWDMRTKVNIHTLGGHTNTVGTVVCQASEPQVRWNHGCIVFHFSFYGFHSCLADNHRK